MTKNIPVNSVMVTIWPLRINFLKYHSGELGCTSLIWENVSFLIASSYRRKIMSCLINGPKTPSAISKQTNIRIEHVTRAIRELEEKNLVKCLTPRSRRGRLYEITKLGKETLNKIPKSLT